MNRYDSYKDSGIEWIGEIPNHWDRTKVKYFGKISSGDSLDSKLIDKEEGNYPVYGGNGVMGYHSNYNIDKEVLIIGRVGEKCGNVHYSDKKVYVNDNSLLFEPYNKEMSLEYLFHNLTQRDLNQLRNKNTQPLITGTIVKDEFVPSPPLKEQQQIVTFLDDKTQKIDTLIKQKEKKIELLKEKRTSLINHVVTKGLKSNVEMKDSGVEWIGEIPNHWGVIKGKYILKILTGSYPSEIIEDKEGEYFVKVDDLNRMDDNYYLGKPKLKIKNFDLIPLEKGIILFPKRGMTIFTNKVVISNKKCFIDPNLMGVKVNTNFNKKYLFNLLKNRGLGDICDSSTIPQINNKHIYPLEFTNPPIQEQQQIVEYLDKQTEEIDTLIQLEQKKIDTLKEYRQSLISEVVTGKIKVV